MTCIAAVVDRGKVWMGGDTLVTSHDLTKTTMSQPKVWVKDDFLFGAAGMALMLQRLSSRFIPVDVEYTDEYVYGPLMNQLRSFIADNELQDHAGWLPGQLLIGFNGGIYKVFSEYFVAKDRNGYDSIGSGSPHALGSLSSSRGGPRQRITKALESAVEHNAACGGPFVIISGARKR